MAKRKVVVFDHNGGWVLTNPNPSDYKDLPHVVNPDLSAVKGLPPEGWTLVGRGVVPRFKESLPPKKPLPWGYVAAGFSGVLNIVLAVLLLIRL